MLKRLPVKAFLWNFSRLFIFTLPCAWLGSLMSGVEGLFIGIALGNVIGGMLAYGYAVRMRRSYLSLVLSS